MNITDLPTDIKQNIVNCMTVDVVNPLKAFSTPLPILWINREWRLLAQDNIYSRAYLFVKTTRGRSVSQPALLHKVDTNYELICRNKLQHLVKHLDIYIHFESDDVDIGYLINGVIEVGIYGSTPVKKINHYSGASLTQYIATLSDGESDEIDYDLGAILARTFQNVKCIDVTTVEDSLNGPTQIDKIVAGYGSQLFSVKYHGYNVCLNLSPANKLTNLDLCVKIERDDIDLSIATATNPQYLQNVSLKAMKPVHLCELFRWSPDSNRIDFNNLGRLELIGNYGNYIHRFDTTENYEWEDNACTHELSFPALVDLRVNAYFVFRAELECLLRAPLKRLSYAGSLSQFLSQFYSKLSSTMEYLKLYFYSDNLVDEHSDIIQKVSKVLSRAQGIKTVELKIESSYCKTGINWPNLTHLTLNEPCRAISGMLDIVDNAPDLSMLKYRMGSYDNDDIQFLLNIKERYPEPSSSKIHMLVFIYSDEWVDESLSEALENLKWYWPSLKNIKFQKYRR